MTDIYVQHGTNKFNSNSNNKMNNTA